MSDQNHAIADDIAFMRTLAEEGRQGPVVGGSILVAAGLSYAAASFVTWYAVSRNLIANGIFFPIVWFGATAVFLAALFVLKRGQPRRGGASRAAGIAWSGAGWAIFMIVVSLMLVSVRLHSYAAMAALPSVILAIYGSCWFVGAMLTGQRWLYAVGLGAFAMALITAWFVTAPATLYLLYGLSLVVLLAAPGAVFMRQAKAAA